MMLVKVPVLSWTEALERASRDATNPGGWSASTEVRPLSESICAATIHVPIQDLRSFAFGFGKSEPAPIQSPSPWSKQFKACRVVEVQLELSELKLPRRLRKGLLGFRSTQFTAFGSWHGAFA